MCKITFLDLLRCGHVVGTELHPVGPENESSHVCKVECLVFVFLLLYQSFLVTKLCLIVELLLQRYILSKMCLTDAFFS